MGLVEGLTEFLPISSTGHLIIVGQGVFHRTDPTFDIGIQIGAISAILILYRQRISAAARDILTTSPRRSGTGQINLLWLVIVAALPASVLGLLFQDWIEELLFNPLTVGLSLVVGGVLLWLLEDWQQRCGDRQDLALGIDDLSYRQALLVGLFQSLALIPGVSRAGAMIAGAMVIGCRRPAAAEFSFLVGLPVLYGASGVKLLDSLELFSDSVRVVEFVVAAGTSCVSALIVVGPFVRFLQNHTFRPFAVYRVVFGGVLLGLVALGVL